MGVRTSKLLACCKSEEVSEPTVKQLQGLHMSRGAEIARSRPFRSVSTPLLELSQELEVRLLELRAEFPISYSPEKEMARVLTKMAFMMEASARELQLKSEDTMDLATLLAIAGARGNTELKNQLPSETDPAMRALDGEFDGELAKVNEKSDPLVEALLSRHLHAVFALDNPSALPPQPCHIVNALRRGCNIALKVRSCESLRAYHTLSDRKETELRVTSSFPLMVADLSQFASITAQALLQKHPLLCFASTSAGEDLVYLLRRVVLDACFDFFRRDLYWYLAQMFRCQDALVTGCVHLRHPSHFGVRPVLRLDGAFPVDGEVIRPSKQPGATNAGAGIEEIANSSGEEIGTLQRQRQREAALASYEDALYLLSSLYTSCRTPSEKLQRLVIVCRKLRQAPAKYYEQQRRAYEMRHEVPGDCSAVKWPTPEELVISPLDLHAILAFLLTEASRWMNVLPELALLGSFLPVLTSQDEGDEERGAITSLMSAVALLGRESS